ncbi:MULTISPECIES: HNH endonuclease signature motif containing protein [Sphingomonadales]|uniref:HNH endonuclease n=1 Tax=Sphingomonadales TaxID=204457 RepID=UPI0012E34535
MSKQCSSCKEVLPQAAFNRQSKARDGLSSWCRSCNAANCRRHYQDNKAEFLAKCRESYAARKASDPQKQRDIRNAWRRANPDKQNESVARWRDENREEYLKRHRAYQSKRRERALGSTEHYTANDVQQAFFDQGGCCAYCREALSSDFHVDHVTPLSRGGSNSADNIALACPPCNLSKGAKLLTEWGGRHF